MEAQLRRLVMIIGVCEAHMQKPSVTRRLATMSGP